MLGQSDSQTVLRGAMADKVARRHLSFAEFVDQALFHPRWGYYSAGAVRFGEGGHYDTYPLALSPLFGHMVAQYAYHSWRRLGSPKRFEVCELGAGNGQLCLDTILWIHERARHEHGWQRFAETARYRVIERSAALIHRQRQQLGPLAEWVRWTRGDLAQRTVRGAPFAPAGLLVANEVFDCLPHHKVVPQHDGRTGLAYVVIESAGRPVAPSRLGALLASPAGRGRLCFREILVDLGRARALRTFVHRHYPELLLPGAARPPYFACPRLPVLLRHAAQLYGAGDALWIDYGDERAFHLHAPEHRKVFAGPPRSGAGVFDRPGSDDITFMVDFSVAATAACDAGWSVVYYGPQRELARRSGVALDRTAVDLIVHHRALTWLLALAGAHPERTWRRGAVTWSGDTNADTVSVRRYVQRSVREFSSGKGLFKLLITRH
jgi:SAM-dependent MidA family methyltransferase